jgi:hypothetical protein
MAGMKDSADTIGTARQRASRRLRDSSLLQCALVVLGSSGYLSVLEYRFTSGELKRSAHCEYWESRTVVGVSLRYAHFWARSNVNRCSPANFEIHSELMEMVQERS